MCHLNVVTRLKDPKLNARVRRAAFHVGRRPVVALARAIDAASPVTRIAIGGEYDQERGSAVAAALGCRGTRLKSCVG